MEELIRIRLEELTRLKTELIKKQKLDLAKIEVRIEELKGLAGSSLLATSSFEAEDLPEPIESAEASIETINENIATARATHAPVIDEEITVSTAPEGMEEVADVGGFEPADLVEDANAEIPQEPEIEEPPQETSTIAEPEISTPANLDDIEAMRNEQALPSAPETSEIPQTTTTEPQATKKVPFIIPQEEVDITLPKEAPIAAKEPVAAAPAKPETISQKPEAPVEEKVGQDDIESMFAIPEVTEAKSKEPAPQDVSADEIAAMISEAEAQTEAKPVEPPKTKSEPASQDDIEAMLAAMDTPAAAPATPEPETPKPQAANTVPQAAKKEPPASQDDIEELLKMMG